jgi:hypothetical protein
MATSYLVLCVLDLKAAHREDRLSAYMDLATLGLRRVVKSENGPDFKLPATAVMGMFEGRNVDDVRTMIGSKVKSIFDTRGLEGEFFVVVSADWACAGESISR